MRISGTHMNILSLFSVGFFFKNTHGLKSLRLPRSPTRKFCSRLAQEARSSSSTTSATEQMRVDSEEQLQKLAEFYSQSSVPSPPTIWKSQCDASRFVDEHIDTVLFDCDGVLYRNVDICPGASECIHGLLKKGKKVLFVTNNGGVNRRQLREKIGTVLGIDSLTNDQMVSSSYSAAKYLKQQLDIGSRVHIIGSAGLCEELANSDFEISGGPSNGDSSSMNRQELEEYSFPEDLVDAIVLGHDTELTFRKLCIANNLLLRNPKALFVTTNEDNFDLVGSDRRHIPGNGCTVKYLEYCSRRSATSVGKPSKTLADLIEKEHGLDPSRSLFVGDRLDTDIRFGNDHGMKSCLVMTGVTTVQTMIDLGIGTKEEPLPHYAVPYVGMLV